MGKKSGASENIRVVIRKRPMSDVEKQNGKETVHLDLGMGTVSVHQAVGEPDRWTFDAVYDNTFSQLQIFKAETMPLVQSVLDGYNATVFAYGQSGSGKTFTMTGDPGTSNAGLMPHALYAIFNGIKNLESPQKSYRVKVQYLELYNGKARDLISKSKKPQNLEIKNFHVAGTENPEVASAEECLRLFDEGTSRRATASTDLNDHSSRSHAIFTLTIVSTDHESDAGSPVIMQSKLNLCDLAGSERQSKTNATGETLRQGCSINLSLSALGTVIDKLVNGTGHVPYRSSPLTMLLKDSLGGNSKTVMFANVSPCDTNSAETISTLRFADRAKQIENKPVKNLDPKDQHIQELKRQVEDLKKRLTRGGGNLEAEDQLREQLEAIELERDQDKQAWERDKLDIERELASKKADNQGMLDSVEKMQIELQAAVDQKKIEENLVIGLRDELTELKRMVMEFIQRVLPDDVMAKVEEQSKQWGDSDGGKDEQDAGLWGRNKIYALFEAFHEWNKKSKGVSNEEVERKVASERHDWEAKLKQVSDTLERERSYFQEELEKEKAQRGEDAESKSKLVSDLQSKEQEVTRLKEKVTRDLEKFKQKLQTKQQDRDETQQKLTNAEEQLQEKIRTLERLQQQLKEKEGSVDQAIKEAQSEQKAAHDRDLEAQRRDLEKAVGAKEEENNHLLSKINQMEIQMKQSVRKQLVQKSKQGTEGDGAGADANDGFLDETELEQLGDDAIDKDMFEELHIQVRLQCRLQRLRHLQQKQLDSLVDRYEKAAHDNRGKIAESTMIENIKKAVAEKDEEIEKIKVEAAKTQDKLVTKINKKLSEFQQIEKKLSEEKQSLEEESKELFDMNERVSRQHEQALETASTLKSLLEQRDNEAQAEMRRMQREIAQQAAQLSQMDMDSEALRKQIATGKTLEQHHNDLKKEYELTKVSLRDQRGQVDAQRARLKNMEAMWAEEKNRSEDLRQQLDEARLRVEKTELHYQQVVKDHGTKMSQLLHEKLEEQQQHYMDELQEQQAHEKQVRERLKKARNLTQKAKQKFDEMVLENEKLQTQFEEFKVSAFRYHQETDALEVEDNTGRIRELIRNQQDQRKQQADAFTGRPTSAMGRGYM
ncbi:Kinesin-II 85 kDa subunit [Diplonema papillatum]|nr:Kinesin-II 85 kDa subunit [Diplonema papillatum]